MPDDDKNTPAAATPAAATPTAASPTAAAPAAAGPAAPTPAPAAGPKTKGQKFADTIKNTHANLSKAMQTFKTPVNEKDDPLMQLIQELLNFVVDFNTKMGEKAAGWFEKRQNKAQEVKPTPAANPTAAATTAAASATPATPTATPTVAPAASAAPIPTAIPVAAPTPTPTPAAAPALSLEEQQKLREQLQALYEAAKAEDLSAEDLREAGDALRQEAEQALAETPAQETERLMREAAELRVVADQLQKDAEQAEQEAKEAKDHSNALNPEPAAPAQEQSWNLDPSAIPPELMQHFAPAADTQGLKGAPALSTPAAEPNQAAEPEPAAPQEDHKETPNPK